MSLWIKSLGTGILAGVAAYLVWPLMQKKSAPADYTIEYTLKVIPDTVPAKSSSLKKSVSIIRERLAGLGYQSAVQNTGETTAGISIFKVTDTAEIRSVITSTGWLQFREVYTVDEVAPMLARAEALIKETTGGNEPVVLPAKKDSVSKEVSDLLSKIETEDKKKKEEKKISELIRFSSPYYDDGGRTVYPAEIGQLKLKDTAAIRSVFTRPGVIDAAPPDIIFSFSSPVMLKYMGDKTEVSLYFLKKNGNPDKALLQNEDIANAMTDFDQEGKPVVSFEFTGEGANKWAYLTKKNAGRSLAIVIDNEVISAPSIFSMLEGRNVILTGYFTVGQTRLLSQQIKSPRLPHPVKILAASLKSEKMDKGQRRRILGALAAFILFGVLGFVILKTLKSS